MLEAVKGIGEKTDWLLLVPPANDGSRCSMDPTMMYLFHPYRPSIFLDYFMVIKNELKAKQSVTNVIDGANLTYTQSFHPRQQNLHHHTRTPTHVQLTTIFILIFLKKVDPSHLTKLARPPDSRSLSDLTHALTLLEL